MDDEKVLLLDNDALRERVRAFMAWADENVDGPPAFLPVAEDDAAWSERYGRDGFSKRDFLEGFEYGLCNARDFLNGLLNEPP